MTYQGSGLVRSAAYLALLVPVMSSGCTTVIKSILAGGLPRDYEVEVVSDPPGARIEVNNDYIGDAPLKVMMRGTPNGGVSRNYVIRALPVEHGQFTQTKAFVHYSRIPSNPIPRRVFFDMHLKPRSDVEVDVNVDIRERR